MNRGLLWASTAIIGIAAGETCLSAFQSLNSISAVLRMEDSYELEKLNSPHNSDSEGAGEEGSFLPRAIGAFLLHALQNFRLAERVIRRFGPFVDPFYELFGDGFPMPFQPENHIRFSAHRPYVDNLLQTKNVRRHA
jgi:hypothetical protein